MPRIIIDYDSDSSFERDHLELSTHQQILTRYISVRDDKKLPPKEKVMKLEHASEKAFLALRRAEIKLAKAKEEIRSLREKIETDGTDAGLKQQLEFEREKNINRELNREVLVYEGVLPPYLETKGVDWINDRRMKWTRENKELREERETSEKLAAMALNELTPYQKTEKEIERLKEQNKKMAAFVSRHQKVHIDAGAMPPNQLVRLAEENMVLKAAWEKSWELSAEIRARQQSREEEAARKEDEMINEMFGDWKKRREVEVMVKAGREYSENRGGRWRKRTRDMEEDSEFSDVGRRVVIRNKPSFHD